MAVRLLALVKPWPNRHPNIVSRMLPPSAMQYWLQLEVSLMHALVCEVYEPE